MTTPTPMKPYFEQARAMWERYGPPGAEVELAGMFDLVDVEYAAVRKGCGLIDQPQRGTLEIRGADRIAFLNRMVTQELKGVVEFDTRRSFWLNRKGRIDADLRLCVLEDRIIADVDIHATTRTVEGLMAYVIVDDVAVVDVTDRNHRLALHGPGAAAVLAKYGEHLRGDAVEAIKPGRACVVRTAGAEVIVERQDSTGEIGLELTVRSEDAVKVYSRLLEAAHENTHGHTGPNARPMLRPIGWHAYNIARIEAGWPLYMLDFGPDSLPGETGVLHDRVSFKKGCYLGQEIVARMNALGNPKAIVVGLRVDEPGVVGDGALRQPVGGAPIFATMPVAGEPLPEAIGGVTSTTTSPMLGGAPVAFAMVKWKHAQEGAAVYVPCAAGPEETPVILKATVQKGLAFWGKG